MSAALVLSDLPQLIATPSEKLRKQEANFFSQRDLVMACHTPHQKNKKTREMPFPLLLFNPPSPLGTCKWLPNNAIIIIVVKLNKTIVDIDIFFIYSFFLLHIPTVTKITLSSSTSGLSMALFSDEFRSTHLGNSLSDSSLSSLTKASLF